MPVKAVYYNKKNIINLFIDYFKKIFYFLTHYTQNVFIYLRVKLEWYILK